MYCITNLQLWPQHFSEFHTVPRLQHPPPIHDNAKTKCLNCISQLTTLNLLTISIQVGITIN